MDNIMTESMQKDNELQSWIFNELMENMRANLYVTELNTDKILFMNETMKKTFGIEDPVGKVCWQILQEGMTGRCPFCPVDRLCNSEEEHAECVWEEINTRTGRTYENYDSLMKWMDGQLVHFQQSVDITDLKKMFDRDDLTGVLNRRAGKDRLLRVLDTAKCEKTTVTVAMYDVNKLKIVNDRYGHKEGDSMLTMITDAVRSELASDDFVFRLSGDEFIVVFYGCSEAGAGDVMKRIQGRLLPGKIKVNKPYEIGFCYGLVEVQPDDNSPTAVIMTAVDERMYAYKKQFYANEKNKEIFANNADNYFIYNKDHLYEALTESTDNFIYLCNIPTNTFRFPPSMVEKFDLPGEVVFNATPVWGNLIHEDDRSRFYQSMQELESEDTDMHNLKYRVKDRDGRWLHIHCRGHVSQDSSGRACLFAGIITILDE